MHRKSIIAASICCAAICVATQVSSAQSTSPARQQPPAEKHPNVERMTNADVVRMVQMGLSDEIIVGTIRAAKATNFDTSVAGLGALKAAKVSNTVILAMVNASRPIPKRGAGALETQSAKNTPLGAGNKGNAEPAAEGSSARTEAARAMSTASE